jgi:DNA-binding NarL/FixJ family response regulator
MQAPATGSSPLQVLIVDADRRVRDSLRDLLCCEVGTDCIVAVGSIEDARLAVDTAEPAVVVIDPRLPGIADGIGLLDQLRAEHPATRVLVMSWSHDADVAGHATEPVLDKNASPEDLVAAITRSVRKGATA